MNAIRVRQTLNKDQSVSYTYYLAQNGRTLNDIGFIEYEKYDGLFTVVKDNGEFYTYLPQANAKPAYLPLYKIIQKGFVVYLVG